MGGRKQKKKINLDWATKEASVFSNHGVPARNLRKNDLGAVIFGTTHNTINECLSRQLFGLPEGHYSYIKNIKEGLVLFLFNYSDRKLHGIFEAAGHGQMNIDQYAWVDDGDGTGYTRYPAQVKIRVRKLCNPLSEEQFQPIIAHNYYESKHFYFELDKDQTNKLVSLFASSSAKGSISTKWNTLYASLPTASSKQEYNVHLSQGKTNLRQALPDNPHHTSKVSYASALAGTSNATTTASSSQPVGEWRALFKSELGFQENTTKDESVPNQEYEDKGDFLQGNTWEESHWAATDKVECDQTWESDLNPQAYAATNKADAVVGNTWDESNWAATDKVECDQTWASDPNPQANAATNKAGAVLKNKWEESHWAATNEAERDQTWASDLNRQANTATNKADDMVGNTWEESYWAATDEAEFNQTWASDLNPQASTATNKSDVMLGNTWGEGQQSAPTCEVEHGQISNMGGKHFAKPSSPQPLDDNLDVNLSLSVETVESDIEKNQKNDNILVPNKVETATNLQSLVAKLMQEFEVMKVSQLKQMQEVEAMKGSQLKQIVKINMLEQELGMSKLETLQLRNRVSFLESGSRSCVEPSKVDNQLPSKILEKFTDPVLIVGGHDGSSWLKALDSYFPSHDIKVSLSPMNLIRRYASAATLNGELYHFGGESDDGTHTVESFNPTTNQWISRPPLYWGNINGAGASVNDKLFVVGGAIGTHCSSEVEFLDMNMGKWFPVRSMQSKRLAPAAAELNNVLYVSGGYDGVTYSSSVERFDPRDEVWCKIPNMNARKGCHSMVVLNEKLYTVGGFSGDRYLATVEYLDTRMGAWVEAEPMNVSRGNFGALVLGGKMYVIGGRKDNDEVLDIVECYKEGGGWEVAANLKAIGKRSHFSAFVM